MWIQDPKNKRWSVEAVIVSGVRKRPFRVNDGTNEFTRNWRFRGPDTIPNDESAPQTGHVTNDQNAHEHHDDQFAADQQRRRRSRRTKPESKKLY